MSLDSFIIAALVDELRATLIGGRVQDVIDVDALGIGLEIYANRRRRYLYLSADARQPRVHLMANKLRRGLTKPTQLGLLLRRFVEGAVIAAVSQPAWERLLEIEFAGGDGPLRLIAELMPRRANLLLVRDGMILDCLKRVGPDENRYRLSLPNHEYLPPPPLRAQRDPSRMSERDMIELLAGAEKKTSQTRRLLPGRVLGLSPLLAQETVFRATGDPQAKIGETDGAALYRALQEATAPLLARRWRPGIGSIAGVPQAVSVLPLTRLDWQDCETTSAALEAYFGALQSHDAYEEAKKPVRAALDDARARLRAKLKSLRQGLRDDSELERLKQSGELILAYQYALADGQGELRAQYEADGPEIAVKLDPAHTPLENARAYFLRYEKAKAAAAAVPALMRETEVELAFIEQLESDLERAASWPDIDDVIQHLQTRGHWRGEKRRRIGGGRAGPLRLVSRGGYVIWVGRNSRQNEKVTFKTANAQDIWLHARDAPGAHVIIRNDGRRISGELIAKAAAIAAWYSKRRDEANVQVDYTRVKYVKAIKGAGPGMATYRNERSIKVQPRDESILQ